MRQVIIARKDLDMSPGKLAAQVSHASNAWLMHQIQTVAEKTGDDDQSYTAFLNIDKETFEGWISDICTKTVCQAKNRYQMEKVIQVAEALGLKEGQDFFLIKDLCFTELEPEEFDEQGRGRTLTCIGFRPLPEDIAHTISKKYQLFH